MSSYCLRALSGIGLACLLAACASSDGTEKTAPEEARSALARNTDPSVADADFQAVVDGNTAFAFDLYGQLADADTNFFCSPLSVSVALAMTWAGARGETESQMANVLHFSLPQETVHPALDKLILDLDARNVAPRQTDEGSKELKLRLSNAAWAQKDYAFVPEYLDTLAVNYGAGVKLLDFAADPPGSTEIINAWVADQTEDKIQNLIPDGAIGPLTRLVLTNTLYFYGNWATAFVKDSTQDGIFHTPTGDVTVPMMHASLSIRYAAGDGWAIADLPYEDDKLAMTVVLPDAGRFDDIRGSMTAEWLDQAVAQMTEQEVSVALPKFRFTWGTQSLADALKALGMTDAFEATADFTGMEPSGDLRISDVLHQAFVGVDESGTEAAAATAVLMLGASLPANALQVDRPFVFFIRDTVTGSVLFVGQVVDPSGS